MKLIMGQRLVVDWLPNVTIMGSPMNDNAIAALSAHCQLRLDSGLTTQTLSGY